MRPFRSIELQKSYAVEFSVFYFIGREHADFLQKYEIELCESRPFKMKESQQNVKWYDFEGELGRWWARVLDLAEELVLTSGCFREVYIVCEKPEDSGCEAHIALEVSRDCQRLLNTAVMLEANRGELLSSDSTELHRGSAPPAGGCLL